MKTDSSTPVRGLSWRRVITRSLVGIFALLLSALAGVAWWLWSWQWGSLAFHESWSPEERTALTEFDTYLCNEFSGDIREAVIFWDDIPEDWPSALSTAYIAKLYSAPIRKQLRDIARSGNAAIPGAQSAPWENITPAIAASMTAHFDALKALVTHGADTNACVAPKEGSKIEGSTTITCVLRGRFIGKKKQYTWEERREVAEFLLAHGTDLNKNTTIIGICCSLALTQNDAAPWMWAIEHGKKVTGEELLYALTLGELHLPLLESMLLCSPDIVNYQRAVTTPLQALAERIRHAEADEMAELEEALDLLLAHGANPALRPTIPDAEEEESEWGDIEQKLPLDILLEKQDFATCGMTGENCEGEADDARTIWQRMCEKLQPYNIP